MPFARRTAAAALAAVLGGLAAPASPAQAAPRPGPETPSVLLLTVDDGAGPRATVLTCGPTGGLHPDPITACRLVARVDGDLDALDVHGAPCTSQYAPVVARAVGIWQTRPISYTRTFGNACLMQRTTASLFTF
ncbi:MULTISPECIES: SSI family serine proteinase inhibitor [unclassified Micromonospora]|uniref:SSI family serine proteinase inhibitor n=1 Tax=unclassified Micromonospora TaxID=2617518 RepID=UPI00188E26F9|nr:MULTISPECIES: SSI family serine proteinase inhibitor [unclassified Micromonospora]MBF5029265.1 proteinase inhibitor I4 serpin [Micromonospora sp. ANENR4]MCZ7475603.1 SSI family serine proteinase inhibitor [Micromonospora sp. WMMC273]WBC06211.1 SSI family serine proteinase inhibitor [Micromonospora sp. WMMA1976]